jgi:retinol dehydrogenase-16
LVLVYKAFDWLLRRFYIGRLGERHIFITGCDTGFGNLAARRLDALGCQVFAGCLTEAGETELTKSCSSRMQPVSLDVSKPDSVRRAFDIVKAKLPPGKGLWGVVNNAGITGNFGPPPWLTVDDYKRTAAVNLYGLIDVTMTFLPLVKMARGRVVNMSSISGRLSSDLTLPYSVAKYGVEAFTDGLRRSLRVFGVRAALIEPGAHKTPIMERELMGRLIMNGWNQASPESRAEYGERYRQYLTTELLDLLARLASDRPQDVVDAYVHALLGRYPRARYLVGLDARFLFTPLTWVPEWLGDWVLARLGAGVPLPAAVEKRLNSGGGDGKPRN